MKKMTENITGACVRSMRVEFNLPHNMQFYRFENGLVDRTLRVLIIFQETHQWFDDFSLD